MSTTGFSLPEASICDCVKLKSASREPSTGSTCVAGSSRAPYAAFNPARYRPRAAPSEPEVAGVMAHAFHVFDHGLADALGQRVLRLADPKREMGL